jgi:hypothetical protein
MNVYSSELSKQYAKDENLFLLHISHRLLNQVVTF